MLPWIPVSLSAMISVPATPLPPILLTPATPTPTPSLGVQPIKNSITKRDKPIAFMMIPFSNYIISLYKRVKWKVSIS